jgi:hypothetical protein
MNRTLFPIIAALCGLTGESHNRGFYAGECKPGSGLSRAMLNPSHVPMIGSEKGDRAEIERINGNVCASNRATDDYFPRSSRWRSMVDDAP